MLVPFFIDSRDLDDPSLSNRARKAHHERLIRIWKRVGLLIHDGSTFESSELYKAISTLPTDLKSKWHRAIRGYYKSAGPRGLLHCVDSVEDCHKLACPDGAVVLVSDRRATDLFGVTDEEVSTICQVGNNRVEICCVSAADLSSVFTDRVELSKKQIRAQTAFQAVWEERLDGFARAPIKKVSVVDRFCIGRHYEHRKKRKAGLSGTERFVELLDSKGSGPKYLTIFSAWPAIGRSWEKNRQVTPADHARVRQNYERWIGRELQRLTSKLCGQTIQQIRIIMCEDQRFGDLKHDRFLRFEKYVLDVGKGLCILEGSVQGTQFSMKDSLVDKAYVSDEENLRRAMTFVSTWKLGEDGTWVLRAEP